MIDVVPDHDMAQVVGLAFVGELRRVHADHHQLVAILLLQPAQVGQDVHAVDAAVGPEVEQHDLADERSQRERRWHVQPVDRTGEFWGADAHITIVHCENVRL